MNNNINDLLIQSERSPIRGIEDVVCEESLLELLRKDL